MLKLKLLVLIANFSLAASEEPIISVFQGPRPDMSTVEIIWPDGATDTFTYNNIDEEKNNIVAKWFSKILKERRAKKTK